MENDIYTDTYLCKLVTRMKSSSASLDCCNTYLCEIYTYITYVVYINKLEQTISQSCVSCHIMLIFYFFIIFIYTYIYRVVFIQFFLFNLCLIIFFQTQDIQNMLKEQIYIYIDHNTTKKNRDKTLEGEWWFFLCIIYFVVLLLLLFCIKSDTKYIYLCIKIQSSMSVIIMARFVQYLTDAYNYYNVSIY